MICNVAAVRRMRGLTVSEFADAVGCTRYQVHRIEKGGVAPQLPLALRISKVLGMGVEALWRIPSYDTIIPAVGRARETHLPKLEAVEAA